MRISDWSSDVCSSDLQRLHETCQFPFEGQVAESVQRPSFTFATCAGFGREHTTTLQDLSSYDFVDIKSLRHTLHWYRTVDHGLQVSTRNTAAPPSEERREGKNCVSTCSSRCCTYHKQTKIKTKEKYNY